MGQAHTSRSPSDIIGHQLRLALYNKERDRVAELLRHPDLRIANLPVEVYVELIQRLWDPATVAALCHGATQENLRALLQTAVLQGSNAVQFKTLFRQIRESETAAAATAAGGAGLSSSSSSSASSASPSPSSSEARWSELHLIRLFPIVCHKANDEMFDAFLEDGSFDPFDTMPLRVVVQRELRRNKTCDVRRIRKILRTHEQQRQAVEALLRDLIPTGKFDASRDAVAAVLNEYLSSPAPKHFEGSPLLLNSSNGEQGGHLLLGSPTYRRRLQAVVVALMKNENVSEKSIQEVASFLPKS